MKPYFFLWAFALILAVQAQINPWQARHRMTSDEYQNTFNNLVGQGYRLNWVSGYTINDEPRFAAIFEKKPSPAWVAHHGMTSAQYQQNFNKYVGQGYRLVLVNGYTVKGTDYYVAIWDKSPSGQWVARHGMTGSAYQNAFNDFVGQGFRLKHVSGYAIGKSARYAAIWEKTNDGIGWVARHGMTSSDYQTAFDTYLGQGYRLVLVNGYQVDNVDYYAAIWDKSPSGPWGARHGMTSDQYQAEFDNNYYQGYVLQVISGYDQGQSDRYAALWVNPVWKGSDLDTINSVIKDYMDANSVPGLSLAITQDDRLVFAKGYGLADQASNTIVTPNSVFRIMSISKSITSTAVMKLHSEGHFNLTNLVFGPGSLTGDTYGNLVPVVNGKRQYNPGVTDITVGMLLEHVSGWETGSSDPIVALETMSPAEVVSKTVANVPLQFTPDTTFNYSNFGFLVLGRLVSDISGVEYEDYVKQNILAPSGVTKMQLANDAGPIANEVTYYPLGVTDGVRVHEFTSFGGWVATPIDLCRWSTHVDRIPTKSDILSNEIEDEMWTPSKENGGYAKGWVVNGDPNNWRGHNGIFGGTGSFFTQRTDGTGFGFMVVKNFEVPSDVGSWTLRANIDTMINKVSAWPSYDLF